MTTSRMTGTRTTGNRGRVGVALAVAMVLLAACGGSGGSGGASGPTSTTAKQGGATSTTAASGPKASTAPAALVAASLVTKAALQAAGLQVTGVEDDGTIGNASGFGTAVRTATANADLTVLLASYESAGNAKQAYRQAAGQGTPLAGVGDAASATTQGAVVLKGAQVLTVTGELSKAQEQEAEHQKEQNGSVDPALFAAATIDAKKLATAIGAKLSGAAATGTYSYVPKDAIDPCLGGASALAATFEGANVRPLTSENPPALQCAVSLGQYGSLMVQTLTAAQAGAAVPATSIDAEIADRAQAGSGSGSGSGSGAPPFTAGPFTVHDLSHPGDLDLLVEINDVDDPPLTRFIVEIYEEPSGSLEALPDDRCRELTKEILDGFLKDAGTEPDGTLLTEYNKVLDKLTANCDENK